MGCVMKKFTTEQWVEKAKTIHGDRYDYSKVNYKGAHQKVIIICKEHGPFEQVAGTHLHGKGCPKCAFAKLGDSKTASQSSWIAKAREVHGEHYDYSKVVYTKARDKVAIICPEHGEFLQEARKHTKGCGCPKCGKSKAGRKPKSKLSLQERVDKLFGKGLLTVPEGENKNSSTIQISCAKHGAFPRRVSDLVSGCGCPECTRERQRDKAKETFIRKAKEKHGDKYDYSNIVYANSKTPVKNIICKEHGPFEQTPSNHYSWDGCPVCGDVTRRASLSHGREAWLDKFKLVHGDTYTYPEGDIVSSNKIKILCPKHGVFEQKAESHLMGHGCPSCVHRVSKPETEVYNYVKSILHGNTESRKSARDVIPPQELDIYVPSKKLAIEFNGNHWHSTSYKPDKLYHQKKSLECLAKGIQLIHVYEYAWETRKEQYKALIAAKLGIYDRRVYARKTTIKPITTYRANKFLDEYHFQGGCSGAAVLHGMFLGEELIGVCTYGKPRFTSGARWELLRLCYLPGVQAIGGSAKLFKHFTRNHLQDGEAVISYANFDYSQGGVYENLGFTKDPDPCPPNYVWVKWKTVLPRYRTQKHRLGELLGDAFDENKSETENMLDAGYKKIFTAGNLKYTYKKCTEKQQNKN